VRRSMRIPTQSRPSRGVYHSRPRAGGTDQGQVGVLRPAKLSAQTDPATQMGRSSGTPEDPMSSAVLSPQASMPDRNRVPSARRRSCPRRTTGSACRAILKTFAVVVLAVQACGPNSSPEPLRQLIEPWVGEAPLDSSVEVIGPPAPTTQPILDLLPPTRAPGEPYATPTPDPTLETPATREASETYVVRYGDSLGGIAYLYGIGAAQIVAANSLMNPNLLSVGQILTIPAPIPRPPGPSFKVLPDSELVYGPSSVLFDLRQFVADWGGALDQYV